MTTAEVIDGESDGHTHLPDETCYSGDEDDCRERAQIFDIIRMAGEKLTTSDVVCRVYGAARHRACFVQAQNHLGFLAVTGFIQRNYVPPSHWWVHDVPPALDRDSLERWLDD